MLEIPAQGNSTDVWISTDSRMQFQDSPQPLAVNAATRSSSFTPSEMANQQFKTLASGIRTRCLIFQHNLIKWTNGKASISKYMNNSLHCLVQLFINFPLSDLFNPVLLPSIFIDNGFQNLPFEHRVTLLHCFPSVSSRNGLEIFDDETVTNEAKARRITQHCKLKDVSCIFCC